MGIKWMKGNMTEIIVLILTLGFALFFYSMAIKSDNLWLGIPLGLAAFSIAFAGGMLMASIGK